MAETNFRKGDAVITTRRVAVAENGKAIDIMAGSIGVFSGLRRHAIDGKSFALIDFERGSYWIASDALIGAGEWADVFLDVPNCRCVIVREPPRHFPAVSTIAVLAREAARKRRLVGMARRTGR